MRFTLPESLTCIIAEALFVKPKYVGGLSRLRMFMKAYSSLKS